jgi:hypothetical protein
MAKETILAAGMVTASEKITVELLDNGETPQMVLIRWPVKVTPVQPGAYADAASKAMRILATASTELARLKAGRRL